MPDVGLETSDALRSLFWFVIVALCWGATNPFMAARSAADRPTGHPHLSRADAAAVAAAAAAVARPAVRLSLSRWLAEQFTNAVLRWRFIIPFAINQAGSLIYFVTLGSADISMAVPITNSLTLLFTSIAGRLLGEPVRMKETIVGGAFITIGVALCVTSR
ncbi:hypothetical protein CAOG_02829 [Capsaspora owczarzaki ATCC 30864]|uniref:Transmembrane protein n=1 Tax=Capsaspora owczarzaki (strain ATCC 30864) TaxID=595528 RepID=A0A0D2X208_CAPO3|nr:hypothetical protein CAOG_02829 [Capsaspora owczarzaki ATCC 30864]KJE91734.1 hypothetical protein CAOG_002829 [Capsaspora owczarzaki ATCC 30864]|eukprot:XP_004348642.1 hypothetical protein CAOG_02829 [Capsaspora owczarzaki ATCC 30864]